jgi:dTDP-4-amino-4,6-dideoxygalactose transaminase
VVSLPMHPYLTDAEIGRVSEAVIALCAVQGDWF